MPPEALARISAGVDRARAAEDRVCDGTSAVGHFVSKVTLSLVIEVSVKKQACVSMGPRCEM